MSAPRLRRQPGVDEAPRAPILGLEEEVYPAFPSPVISRIYALVTSTKSEEAETSSQKDSPIFSCPNFKFTSCSPLRKTPPQSLGCGCFSVLGRPCVFRSPAALRGPHSRLLAVTCFFQPLLPSGSSACRRLLPDEPAQLPRLLLE